jgi:uracil-DNA glycosylase
VSFAEPPRDCPLCPRLVALRTELRAKHPAWSNAPVPSFGALDARLLIVGLAPGLKGANRTGRPFTGDYAGDLLYATLAKYSWSRGAYRAGREDAAWAADTLVLAGARIANAVRCLPPENKPTPKEAATCRPFLVSEITAMPKLRVVLALGRLAHDQVLTAFGRKVSSAKFAHGAMHDLGDGRALADSYHCSRYNTNTGRLTPPMFEAVFDAIAEHLT